MDREQALEAALGQIERNFGKGAVMKMNDRAAVSIGAVSTGSSSSACTSASGGPGFLTSRSFASAARHGSARRCPTSASSVRPGPLSTIPCCGPAGPSTKSSNPFR